jgi:hypothetical protein
MSPTAVESTPAVPIPAKGKVGSPLQVTGALKDLESVEISPTIGREYPKADLAEILKAPNSDELIRDLAVTSKYHSHEPAKSLRFSATKAPLMLTVFDKKKSLSAVLFSFVRKTT